MQYRYIAAGRSLCLDRGACVGCGRCVEVCPHAVFALAGAAADIVGRDRCMECGACGKNCPAAAIAVESGVGCASAIVNGILRHAEPSCDCGPACCGSSGTKRRN